MLGSFELIEEVINSVFGKVLLVAFAEILTHHIPIVFIIRFAERRIDQLLDTCLLDFCPLPSEYETVQFESDWSFLRPFSGKKKATSSVSSSGGVLSRGVVPSSPPSHKRPLSPSQSQGMLSSSTSRFSSLRKSFTRGRPGSTTPLASLFPDAPPSPSPVELISVLTALHTLLALSDVNPGFTAQLWSQVMYWTSCEHYAAVIGDYVLMFV